MTEAGLDSIGSVELRNAASALLGKELPATLAFDYPSVKAIAGYIVSQLQASSGGAADGSNARVASAEAADAVKQVWSHCFILWQSVDTYCDVSLGAEVNTSFVGKLCGSQGKTSWLMSELRALRTSRTHSQSLITAKDCLGPL